MKSWMKLGNGGFEKLMQLEEGVTNEKQTKDDK